MLHELGYNNKFYVSTLSWDACMSACVFIIHKTALLPDNVLLLLYEYSVLYLPTTQRILKLYSKIEIICIVAVIIWCKYLILIEYSVENITRIHEWYIDTYNRVIWLSGLLSTNCFQSPNQIIYADSLFIVVLTIL